MDARLSIFADRPIDHRIATPFVPQAEPAAEPVVKLTGFNRTFGANTIIANLDLTIAQGEFVALLGRSGSGKTTLLRTLAGLDDASGQDVRIPTSRAVVFQDARLLPWKKVWRNVALGLRDLSARVRIKAERALHEVGLGHRLDAWPLTLSGGEAQRVKLAKELARRSTGQTLYILDEPTTGLHFEDVRKLLEVLQRLVDQGNSVVVIEHNLDVIKVADWIIDLGPEGGVRGGEIVATGTPEQVAANPASFTGHYLKPLLER